MQVARVKIIMNLLAEWGGIATYFEINHHVRDVEKSAGNKSFQIDRQTIFRSV